MKSDEADVHIFLKQCSYTLPVLRSSSIPEILRRLSNAHHAISYLKMLSYTSGSASGFRLLPPIKYSIEFKLLKQCYFSTLVEHFNLL